MRVYNEQGKVTKVQCNGCGKALELEQTILKEGCFQVDFLWGYFSSRDGITHSFDLCEECYDKFVGMFSIPVMERESTELI